MLVQTTWKARPISPDQANRMMTIWGKLEAALAENPHLERVNFYICADGSGGTQVIRATDTDAAHQFALESSLALSEFLEFDSRIVLEMDTAMSAILKALEYASS